MSFFPANPNKQFFEAEEYCTLDLHPQNQGAQSMSFPSKPSFTTAPTIQGEPVAGGTVSCAVYTTGQVDTITYAWSTGLDSLQSWTVLTNDNLGDMISCNVTLAGPGGSVSQQSNVVGPVMASPVVSTADCAILASEVPKEYNPQVTHGDSWKVTYQFLDSETQAHDLTGATVTADAQDSQANLTVLSIAVNADPTTGSLTVSSAAIAAGIYHYDIQEVNTAGDTTTWAHGQLAVTGDITP